MLLCRRRLRCPQNAGRAVKKNLSGKTTHVICGGIFPEDRAKTNGRICMYICTAYIHIEIAHGKLRKIATQRRNTEEGGDEEKPLLRLQATF